VNESQERRPSPHRSRWTIAVAVAFGAMGAGALVVVLVLTGIIAEPETVIETIIRTLFGG